MTQKQKLVETFRTNTSSLKFKQLIIVLEHFGFIMIQAKGSHVKFKHPKLSADLVIPIHNGDCKDFYKREAFKRVSEIEKI
jgi:predicted RNA binding protein YcfA (HicA-like mRNA interferase family)